VFIDSTGRGTKGSLISNPRVLMSEQN